MRVLVSVLLFCAVAACVFAQTGELRSQVDARMLREKLTKLNSIEDNNQLLFAFGSMLRENHLDILLRQGDRVSIGKGQLVFRSNGDFQLIARTDDPQTTGQLAHYVTESGAWVQNASKPENATHFLISSQEVVFVINLAEQRVAVLQR